MTQATVPLDVAAMLVLLIYHAYLARTVRRRPTKTAMGCNRLVREQWIARVMSEGLDLLAVQTLRNSTMAATFLASTAILIALGAMHLITGTAEGDLGNLAAVGAWPLTLSPFTVKVSLLSILLLAAFAHFTQTLRNYNHVCFMVATPAHNEAQSVARVLTRGAHHYTLGMRAYYLAIPVSLWLFGSVAFLIASVLLIIMLAKIDFV